MPLRRRIPTYFSHSYRVEDRDVNEFFWRTFDSVDFGFTVDPQPGRLSTCHLEMTMRDSACFVAVVTHRREQPTYKCSPFMIYEYGLAVRARKPRLVFVEKGVPGSLFPIGSELQVFDRAELESYDGFQARIQQLQATSYGYSSIGDRLIGDVGIALPDTEIYREAREAITYILRRVGYSVVPIQLEFRDPGDIAFHLDRFDFVIVDVGSPELPDWLYPTLFGRFVPTVNLMYHDPAQGMSPEVPQLVAGEILRDAAPSGDLVLWWHTVEELEEQLEQQVNRFDLPRQQFRTIDEGIGYFRSIGRVDGSIFLSTAGQDNALAREIGRALKLQNFTFFHYVYNNPITPGANWLDRLDGLIRSSRVFVPLVSQAYWDSEYCRKEFETALTLREEGRLDIIPYFLDESGGALINQQGADVRELDEAERVARITRDMDRFFTSETARMTGAGTRRVTGDIAEQPDIAIVTVRSDEYEAVLRTLENPILLPSVASHANTRAWQTGTITAVDGRRFRVVLTLARTGPGGTAPATDETVERFQPSVVLAVGIAGGLAVGMARGDAVVSERIHGYERGRGLGRFHPRDDWNYPADSAIAAMATALSIRAQDWRDDIATEPPAQATASRIFVGPVAAGDDPSGPLFAKGLLRTPELVAVEAASLGVVQAVEQARRRGHTVQFATVRGISELPSRRQIQDATDDLAQTEEHEAWRRYAADVAATLTAHLIRNAWPYPPRT